MLISWSYAFIADKMGSDKGRGEAAVAPTAFEIDKTIFIHARVKYTYAMTRCLILLFIEQDYLWIYHYII